MLEGVDVLDPPKKIVYVAGEALDFSFIPTRATLKGIRIIEDMRTEKISEADGMDKIIELIADVCSRSNPKITVDWILDNTNIPLIEKMGQDLAGITNGEERGTGNTGEPAKN